MKLINMTGSKIINVGEIILTPGATSPEIPDSYAKLPAVKAFIEKGSLTVLETAPAKEEKKEEKKTEGDTTGDSKGEEKKPAEVKTKAPAKEEKKEETAK